MITRPIARVSSVIAVVALAVPLAACSGGQSVSQACLQTNVALATTFQSIDTDVEAALQKGMEGEEIDLAAVFTPAGDALAQAQKDVSNAEVQEALDAFVGEFDAYAETVEGADWNTFASFNQLDPNSDEYARTVDEIESASLELQESIMEHLTGLSEAGDELTTLCNE